MAIVALIISLLDLVLLIGVVIFFVRQRQRDIRRLLRIRKNLRRNIERADCKKEFEQLKAELRREQKEWEESVRKKVAGEVEAIRLKCEAYIGGIADTLEALGKLSERLRVLRQPPKEAPKESPAEGKPEQTDAGEAEQTSSSA